MTGPSWRDPWSVPAPLSGPEPTKPIRVALVLDPGGEGTAGQVQEGVRKARRALEHAGYAVDELEPPSIETAATTALDMIATDTRAMSDAMPFSLPADTMEFLSSLLEVAGGEQNGADEGSDRVGARTNELRVAGKRADQEASRAEREEECHPPLAPHGLRPPRPGSLAVPSIEPFESTILWSRTGRRRPMRPGRDRFKVGRDAGLEQRLEPVLEEQGESDNFRVEERARPRSRGQP